MTQIALVQNGVVVQAPMIVTAGMTLAQCYHSDVVAQCVSAPDGVLPGWVTKDGGKTFSAPPTVALPVVVPPSISRRQFYQQLTIDGDITEAEALDVITAGTLPAKLATAIGNLPSDQQFAAKMLAIGATSFDRSSPVVVQLGDVLGKGAADLDTLWVAAAKL